MVVMKAPSLMAHATLTVTCCARKRQAGLIEAIARHLRKDKEK
jgi:hypothetical protein